MTDADPKQPLAIPVTDAARESYNEAVRMRPSPDLGIGPGSTETLLPEALTTIDTSAVTRADQPTPPFSQVLAERRSIRTYWPLALAGLVELLESVFALRAFALADDGAVRRFRPIPSAGGRHPLTPLVLIDDVEALQPGLWRYDPDGHQLLLVRTPSPALDSAWEAVAAAGQFEVPPPAAIVLAARFDATLARYPEGASLVWRDAGVALGCLHLAATSLGLGSCILGTAGVLGPADLTACGIIGELVGDVGTLAVGGGSPARERT